MMHAGVTRIAFPPERDGDVEEMFRTQIVPLHEKELKGSETGLRDHLWLIDRARGEAIGIAVYDDEKKLRSVEKIEPHANPRKIRVPDEAPDGYPTQRAEAIRAVGGAIRSSYWYDVIGRD